MGKRLEYNNWHNPLESDEETNAPWHGLLKKYLKGTPDLLGAKVLEIGCGRGGFACWLANHTFTQSRIVAADVSEIAIHKGRELATKNGRQTITWEVTDIEAISHPDHSFDTVISCETIEHVPHPFIAIRELVRVLKVGGTLLLTVPNYLGTLGLYRLYLRLCGRRYTEAGQPINNFTVLPLVAIWVKWAGCRLKRIDGVGHYLPCPRRPPIEIPIFNEPRILMRWMALHSVIVAKKR